MTLQQLKYVVAVAKHQSISEAAKHLYISQPTLSNAIKDLENELSLTIFTRTNKGIHVSVEGLEFLGYARQVVEQTSLLEEKYLNETSGRQHFSVSTQHYSFAVNAFVELIQTYGMDEYDFTLRETRTNDIIEDVHLHRSELGILYLNEFNEKVITKILREKELVFHELFCATPHVFISKKNPLAENKQIQLEDLEPYPCLSFEQGDYNSFYFSEEILSTIDHQKNIRVSDRATLFNLVIGLNGYTISTGVIDSELNGEDIIAKPLKVKDPIRVGYVSHKNVLLSSLAQIYIEALKKSI